MHINYSNIDILKEAIMMEFEGIDIRLEANETIKTNKSTSFINEYRTVSIGLPRQQGNTTLAIKIAKEFNKPLIITTNNETARLINSKSKLNTTSYRSVRDYVRGNGPYDLVIFDDPKFIPDEMYNEIFELTLAPCLTSNFKVLKVGQI